MNLQVKTSVKKQLHFPFLLLILCGLFLGYSQSADAQDLDVPYVPTPDDVVERMLDMADVQPSDYVIDLGSGDGRIVIAAAKRGASGHGIDLDPERVSEARKNALKAGVDDQVMFMEENIFNTDFSEASVITMYLLPSVNKKLRPELLSKLEPGTEVVSHSFDMGNWKADKKVVVRTGNGANSHEIYYWVIPAKVDGTWNWSVNGTDYTMDVSQEFQEITVNLSNSNGSSFNIQKAQLQGRRMTIRATNGSQNYIFSGRVEGNQITGMMQHHNGDEKTFSKWSASK